MPMTNRIIEYDGAVALLGYESAIDLIVTSPPYDNVRSYGGHEFRWGEMAYACSLAIKPGGVICWVVNDAIVDGSITRKSYKKLEHYRDQLGRRHHDTIIYHKRYGLTKTPDRYVPDIEYVWVLSKGKPAVVNRIEDVPCESAGTRRNKTIGLRRKASGEQKKNSDVYYRTKEFRPRGQVWTYGVGHGMQVEAGAGWLHDNHPALMPIKLAQDLIYSYSNEGDLVCDPMAGAGTTLKAAQIMGRRYLGIEINKPYVDTINKRLAQQVLEPEPIAVVEPEPSEQGEMI